MKYFFLLTLMALSFTANASSLGISCLERSGFVYKVYPESGEILVIDESGRKLDILKNTKLIFETTVSAYTKKTVRFIVNGIEIADVTFEGNDLHGFGEFIDHDQPMVCFRHPGLNQYL